DEAEQIREFDRMTLALLAVDDFAPEDLARQAPTESKPARPRSGRKKGRASGTPPADGESPAPPAD
ncbi:MAG TPA: hypothetical protein VLD39_03235, partial [Gammaproteobacteria bacterium]|nr:hypothetical protein [Gammaproteobacteria bacterium]